MRLALLAVVVCAACTGRSAHPSEKPGPRATLAMTARDAGDGATDVTLSLTATAHIQAASLVVAVPPGVELVRGPTRAEVRDLSAGAARSLTVRVRASGPVDISGGVRADDRSAGTSVHLGAVAAPPPIRIVTLPDGTRVSDP
jgi:hypothetical protein